MAKTIKMKKIGEMHGMTNQEDELDDFRGKCLPGFG